MPKPVTWLHGCVFCRVVYCDAVAQAVEDQGRQLRAAHTVLFGTPKAASTAEAATSAAAPAAAEAATTLDAAPAAGNTGNTGSSTRSSSSGGGVASLGMVAQCGALARRLAALEAQALGRSHTLPAAEVRQTARASLERNHDIGALAAEVASLRAASAAADASAAGLAAVESRRFGRVDAALVAEGGRVAALSAHVAALAQQLQEVRGDSEGVGADLGARLDTFARLALSRLAFEDTVDLCRRRAKRKTPAKHPQRKCTAQFFHN